MIALKNIQWKLWVHRVERKDKEQWSWLLQPTSEYNCYDLGLFNLEFEGYGTTQQDANNKAFKFLSINNLNTNFKKFSYRRF